jgi:transcriptional regulator with XRE-family HTH domain
VGSACVAGECAGAQTVERGRTKRVRRGSVKAGAWSDLRAARMARGLTIPDAAKLAGVSERTMHTAEQGKLGGSADARLRILNALVSVPVLAPKTVAEAIYAARVNAGLSQTAMGELVGVWLHTLNKWEAGSHAPSPRYRARLFAEVGLDLRAWFPDDVYDDADRGDTGRFGVVALDRRDVSAVGEVCA